MKTIENEDKEKIIFKDEAKSGNSSVSETAAKHIYNSIVRIELKDESHGTGFFMIVKIANIYLRCLITNFHVIKQDRFNKKEEIDIYYGEIKKEKRITIKLDENKRYIKLFPKYDFIIIEIIKTDNIQENKFLNYDLNYKSEKGYNEYLNKNIYLAGYPNSVIDNKDRHISSGKIKKIDKYYFHHESDTRSGSSGSPVCLLENKKVIGIHKAGNSQYSINQGVFIGYVLDELNKDEEKEKISNNQHNIIYRNLFSNIIEKNKYFFTLEEYNIEFYRIHHKISKYYVNQTENNYNNANTDLNNYLLNSNIKLEKTREQIMKSLNIFKDIQVNYEEVVRSDFIKDINILLETNYELFMEKFGYFIAGFMKALDLYGKNKNAYLPVECDLEKKKIEMDYKDLIQFKNNIDKIISFKTFLNEIAPLNHLHGKIYQGVNYISSFFREAYNNYLLDKRKFYVSLAIKYKHKDKIWISNCISVSTSAFPEKIFQLFTFLRIKNVIINEEKKFGEIKLESIGRKEILEEKICNDLETNYIIYNSKENIFEIDK